MPTIHARFADAVLIRLFRRWAMAREAGEPSMPAIHGLARQLGLPDQTAPAAASLFELVEGHLGRRLVRGFCCAPEWTADERALLCLFAVAPGLQPGRGTREVPHGLPGAICWAVRALRGAFGLDPLQAPAPAPAQMGRGCPFGAAMAGPAPQTPAPSAALRW